MINYSLITKCGVCDHESESLDIDGKGIIRCPKCLKEIIKGTDEHPEIVKDGGKLFAHKQHCQPEKNRG